MNPDVIHLKYIMTEDKNDKTNVSLWLLAFVFGGLALLIFAATYWRTQSILWSSAAVVAEFMIGATYVVVDQFWKYMFD